mgnify:CR=1 FL=1
MKAAFVVIKEVKVRAKGGELALVSPGKTISLEPEKAETFVKAGKLKPLSIVENMSLEQFGKSRLALKVESAVLNETVYFTPNETIAALLRREGFTCYTARELEVLTRKQFQLKELKKLHEIKAVFPGSNIIQ